MLKLRSGPLSHTLRSPCKDGRDLSPELRIPFVALAARWATIWQHHLAPLAEHVLHVLGAEGRHVESGETLDNSVPVLLRNRCGQHFDELGEQRVD